MNRGIWIAVCIVFLIGASVSGQSYYSGYYVLASSGIGKPVMAGEGYESKLSIPIHTDWFFNEFKIPGLHAGYEHWRLEAEDQGGDAKSIGMSFFEIGASWSPFGSRVLGIKGGWILPFNIPDDRYSNTEGPKGPFAGVFILGNFDPYWLEIGFKRYFWKGSTTFGTYFDPEMWTFTPPQGLVYVTIHYNLFYYYYY